MSSTETRNEPPLVLMDQPDDGYCEERGWVEATVPEDAARDLLVPFVLDEEGRHARPVGEAARVWLNVPESSPYPDEERWCPCEPGAPGAREFFAFDATDCEPAEAAPHD